ncbi:MAG: hypothetical protein R6V55_15040 [Desulfovermiculus sp.]
MGAIHVHDRLDLALLPRWGRICWLVVVFVCVPLSLVYGQQDGGGENDSNPLSLQEKRIVSILRDKLADLDQREKAVQAEEEELKVLQGDVEEKLEKMQALRQSLQELLGQKRRVQKERVKELSGIFESMNPGQAAQAMLSMDRKLAIGILSNMRKKLAGEVLDQMPGEKAAEISGDYSNMGGGEPPP